MDIEIEAYNQCHEHIKETDKKRDQISALYLVVVGLVFANYDKLPAESRLFLLLGLGLVGFFIILTVIQYRKWHIIYVRCAQAMGNYIITANLPVEDRVIEAKKALAKLPYRSTSISRFNPFDSAEAAIFLAITFVCFIPWQLLLSSLGCLIPSLVKHPIILALINYLVFEFIIYTMAFMILRHVDLLDPFDQWIISSVVRNRELPNASSN
jgi:hypothetical protein